MLRMTLAALSVFTLGIMFGACTKGGAGSKDEPRPSAATAATSKASPEVLSAEGRQSIAAALDAYEQIRGQLSKDDIAGVAASAGALGKAASAAASKAPEKLRVHLQKIASSARGLEETSKEDAGAVRRAFGEVSRFVVALLAAEPALQQGRHVFECPMAKGYKKWVQTTADISNPYMGAKMPSCGSASDWKAGG